MNTVMYAILGLNLQHLSGDTMKDVSYLGFDPDVQDKEKMKNAMNFYLYHGIVRITDKDVSMGVIQDIEGNSDIINFQISETELGFVQIKNGTRLKFSFVKSEENVWDGSCHIEGQSKTQSVGKCIVTELKPSFFHV